MHAYNKWESKWKAMPWKKLHAHGTDNFIFFFFPFWCDNQTIYNCSHIQLMIFIKQRIHRLTFILYFGKNGKHNFPNAKHFESLNEHVASVRIILKCIIRKETTAFVLLSDERYILYIKTIMK